MKLIYTPSGAAGEYANKGYAANLFNGCLHGCLYCYVPRIKRMKPEAFSARMTPQKDVLHRLKMDLAGRKLEEPLFLCFSCDPYPPDDELCAITRKAIEIVMESGNAVNILTKGGMRAARDFDLLKQDKRNQIGATLTFLDLRMSRKWEPLAAPPRKRIKMLDLAKENGISTWASMEPVIVPKQTLQLITEAVPFVDVFKVGKWNHAKDAAGIDWKGFYHEAKDLLDNYNCRYMIKQDLAIAAGCSKVTSPIFLSPLPKRQGAPSKQPLPSVGEDQGEGASSKDAHRQSRRGRKVEGAVSKTEKNRRERGAVVKQTGILMVDQMRDSAIEDRKTHTRRVIVCRHEIVGVSSRYEFATQGPHTLSLEETPGYAYVQIKSGTIIGLPCPYGAVGDRIYLKEDVRLTRKRLNGKLCIIAEYRFNYKDTGFRQYKWEDLDKETRRRLSRKKSWGRWTSKLLMYKFLARVWFEITQVRVERVQDISPEDAVAEGLVPGKTLGGYDGYGLPGWDVSMFRMSPVDAYQWLWNSINDERGFGWNKNPWCWVVVFRRLKEIE